MKSATRRAKKRWLGRHDSPGRRRLRTAAAAAAAEVDAPAVGRWWAASEWAPRRHIGGNARAAASASAAAAAIGEPCRVGGSDLAGLGWLGQWELPVVGTMRRDATRREPTGCY